MLGDSMSGDSSSAGPSPTIQEREDISDGSSVAANQPDPGECCGKIGPRAVGGGGAVLGGKIRHDWM